MKFIRDLLAKKQAPVEASTASSPAANPEPKPAAMHVDLPKSAKLAVVEQEAEAAPADTAEARVALDAAQEVDAKADEILRKINADIKEEAPADAPKVNIWDLDEDAAPAPEATPASRRRRRNQTRLLGFNPDDVSTLSPFETAEKVAPTARTQFPVGWIVVSDGPGRGECFALEAGMSQIGRGEDQAVQLDFGDNSVSRVNHAAIVYDQETHAFILGHGGKKNIVRLNGKPVISNEILSSHDEIKVGETTLRFVALCSEQFNWVSKEAASGEQEHVAIA